MNKFFAVILFLAVIGAAVLIFPSRGYYTYQGISPDTNWKPEKCFGVSYEIKLQYPDGPDRNCFGVVFK